MPLKRIDSLKDYPEAFLSVKQAADFLDVSETLIQRQIEKGALPARRFGGVVRILKADFQAYVGSTGRTGGDET
jgi:excisionase family DNA binding protein